MQNADWVALIRRLPQELHNQLVLVLQNRMEISVETVFRLEPAYAVIRGRLAGTTEGGLLFMLPYDQLTGAYFFKAVTEAEVNSIFTGPVPLRPSSNQGRLKPSSIAPMPAVVPVAPPSINSNAPPPRPVEAPATAARNNLLERLRAARNAALPPGATGKS